MKLLSYIAVFCLVLLPNFSSSHQSFSHQPFTIVIDAGHGGKDSGALGSKTKEKDIALALALRLGTFVRDYMPDVRVLYTRNKDVFIPVHQRTEFANRHQADIFFSIHCNATQRSTTTGTETYVMGLHRAEENLTVAKRENEAVLLEQDYQQNYDGYNPNSAEGHIMLSMYQNAYLSHSLLLAQKIEEQFKTKVKRRSRGVKQAGFVVLRTATMPSVLVEAGFLTNSTEETYLKSDNGQIYMASAMFRAIKAYRKTLQTTKSTEWKAKLVTTTNTPVEEKKESEVTYRVQLASSPVRIATKTGVWTQVEEIECKKEDAAYKYMTGEHYTITMAAKRQSYWRAKGFLKAIVVAYHNGKQIPLTKAVAIQKGEK
jgi:N-acetylmuramoyl-L-alanine amidase